MRNKLDLVVSGTGDDSARLSGLAAGRTNVHFTGHVNDRTLTRLYSEALAIIHCPVREDYGLVAVEAFLSGKPVVTCTDSGEPARLVKDGATGFVTLPDPDAMAAKLDWLVENPAAGVEFGRRGQAAVAGLSWDKVTLRLLEALRVKAA
jgi:glycosyltransferase involved in cell wall biosynthesis